MPSTLRRVAALLLGLAPLLGTAETSPYYVGLRQSFGHDSNVFRLPDRTVIGDRVLTPESSGLISTTLLLAGIDQPIGRQRLYGDLSAGYASYSGQSQLNSPTYGLTAGIDWETVQRLSGNLQFDAGRRLGRYGDRDIPTGLGSNDESYQRLALVARLGEWRTSRMWLQLDAVWDRVVNEVDFAQPVPVTNTPPLRLTDGYEREETSRAVGAGVRYRLSGATVVGAGVRTAWRTRDLERSLLGPQEVVRDSLDSRRHDVDFVLAFEPSDLHDLRARLSYGTTDYDGPGVADRSGWSGSLRWTWRPTGKLASHLRLLYDSEDRDFGGSSAADGGGDRQTRAAEWRLDYAATAKVTAHLQAARYQRDYSRRLGSFTDRDTTLSLGADWAALRSTTVGCSVATQRRSASSEVAFGRNSFDATFASCYVQVMVR